LLVVALGISIIAMGADVGGEGGCSALLVGIPMTLVTLAGLYLIMVNLGNAFFPHHEREPDSWVAVQVIRSRRGVLASASLAAHWKNS
jgi:hypothetical protein